MSTITVFTGESPARQRVRQVNEAARAEVSKMKRAVRRGAPEKVIRYFERQSERKVRGK